MTNAEQQLLIPASGCQLPSTMCTSALIPYARCSEFASNSFLGLTDDCSRTFWCQLDGKAHLHQPVRLTYGNTNPDVMPLSMQPIMESQKWRGVYQVGLTWCIVFVTPHLRLHRQSLYQNAYINSNVGRCMWTVKLMMASWCPHKLDCSHASANMWVYEIPVLIHHASNT